MNQFEKLIHIMNVNDVVIKMNNLKRFGNYLFKLIGSVDNQIEAESVAIINHAKRHRFVKTSDNMIDVYILTDNMMYEQFWR